MSFNAYRPKADPVCRESWWVVCATRQEFYQTAAKRLPILRAAFGSAPVSTIHTRAEASFMDKIGTPKAGAL